MNDVTRTWRATLVALLSFSSGCVSQRTLLVPFDSTASLVFSDRNAFALREADGHGFLECLGKSAYSPPFRSPLAIALARVPSAKSFTLAVEARSTTAQYPHRDLVVVFGYQSPTRFYYVHLAPNPDPHAHGIFKVFDADRVRIDPVATKGFEWGEGWHAIEIERNAEAGSIEVRADGEGILSAVDHSLEWGLIGVGSFDDTGEFRNLEIRGDLSFEVDSFPLFGDLPDAAGGSQP